jgi:hypothetical protein
MAAAANGRMSAPSFPFRLRRLQLLLVVQEVAPRIARATALFPLLYSIFLQTSVNFTPRPDSASTTNTHPQLHIRTFGDPFKNSNG